MLDRGDERLWQRESCVNSQGMLSASRVKSVFARLVREAISSVGFERYNCTGKWIRHETTMVGHGHRFNWIIFGI